MIKTLEARGFLAWVPGAPRTLWVLVPPTGQAPPVDEVLRVATLVIERLVPALRPYGDDAVRDGVSAVLAAAGVAASPRDRDRVDHELRRATTIALGRAQSETVSR
jgi:hypothetical protein